MYMLDLHKLIKDDRENLRETTIRTYVLNLKRLNDGEVPKSLDFVENIDDVKEKIKNMKLSTKRNMITAIMVVLSAVSGYDDLRELYRKELGSLNTEYEKYVESHMKDMKQEENWVTTEQLNGVLKNYMKEIRKNKLHKDTEANMMDKMLIQKAVVAGLYSIFEKNDGPRRLEYAGMKIIYDRNDVKPKQNYLLILSKRTKYFVFQSYKTSGTYGMIEKLVPNKLNTIINIWLKHNKTNDFLINSKGTPMTSNTLGKFINVVFSPLGKNITLNLIRHVFISERVDLTSLHNNKLLAHNMGHSIQLQEDYIKK